MDNPKYFWKTKNVFPNKTEKTAIKTDDGKIVTDKLTIAQMFNEFFTCAVSRLIEVVGPRIITRQFSNERFTNKHFILQPVFETFVLNH